MKAARKSSRRAILNTSSKYYKVIIVYIHTEYPTLPLRHLETKMNNKFITESKELPIVIQREHRTITMYYSLCSLCIPPFSLWTL